VVNQVNSVEFLRRAIMEAKVGVEVDVTLRWRLSSVRVTILVALPLVARVYEKLLTI
jgi:hypothetical protein